MKTILKITIPLFVLLIASIDMMADIHVTVYGKGGIVVRPDSTTVVCPIWSKDKCADVTLEEDGLENTSGITGTLTYHGRSEKVEIIEMPNLRKEGNGYVCHGIVVKKL